MSNKSIIDEAIEQMQQKMQDSIEKRTGDYRIGLYAAINIFENLREVHKEEMIKNITDYNIQVSEFLLNPLFNLEHSKHGIACEKLSNMRNQFIDKQFTNKTYGGNK